MSLLSAFGASRASCVVLWGLLTMVYVVAAVLYAHVAPLRVPAWSALHSLMSASLAAIALVNALGESGAVGDSLRVQAVSALSSVVVALSGILAAHMLAISALEMCVWADPSAAGQCSGRDDTRIDTPTRRADVAVQLPELALRLMMSLGDGGPPSCQEEQRLRLKTLIALLAGLAKRPEADVSSAA